MSKTFGELRAGDKVYVIKGSNVKIVKVSVAEPSPTDNNYTWIVFGDYEYSVYSDSTSFYHDTVGDIYCDIDDAIKTMKERCENALQNYKRASGALNKLETKKKMI